MPQYCYRMPDNSIRILMMSVEEKATRERSDKSMVFENGLVGQRDYKAEHGNFQHCPGNWPMYSDAAGVGEDQVEEATKHSREIGIPTDFTPDGRAIFTSPGHRKKYCEAIGMFDRNGGYSDPQRQTRREDQ